MLNKTETEVLRILLANSNQKNTCLLSIEEMLALSDKKKNLTAKGVETALVNLENGDYLDVIHSTRKDTPVFCVTLHFKGQNYLLERKSSMRAIYFKLFLAVGGAIVSFIVGRILYLLFT